MDLQKHYHHVMHIKDESKDLSSSLSSSPFTTSPTLPRSSSSSTRRRSSTSAARVANRPKPYPSIHPDNSRKELVNMSHTATYGQWTDNPRTVHRLPNGDSTSPYMHPNFINNFIAMPDPSQNVRPLSTSSTLAGAISDVNLSPTPRHVRSPSSGQYSSTTQQNLWNPQMQMQMMSMANPTYPGVAGPGPSSYVNQDLESTSSYQPVQPRSTDSSPRSPNYSSTSYLSSSEDQLSFFKRRVQELELECKRYRATVESMRGSVNPSNQNNPSQSFEISWKKRTELRKKLFCSPNRAGNALCAWHNPRRERRVFPPRNAPPGYLNCGCTYEEALFEESLARHGVGSYHPGETVRMDPALRNPLLKLLEKRFNYKDGDFEHDPNSQCWNDGESPDAWERRAQSGQIIRKRQDGD